MRWISLLFVSTQLFAVSDTFLLAEILVNTTRELEELERLITKTQQHTKKLTSLADTVDDYSYRVQRLKAWAQDLKDLASDDPKDLSEVNHLIRQIRIVEEDSKRIYKDYAIKIYKNKREGNKFDQIAVNQHLNAKRYRSQALRKQANTSASMQQVAQNTATMAYEQAKTNQMIALQNKKIAELYEVVLREEKERYAKKVRVQELYSEK